MESYHKYISNLHSSFTVSEAQEKARERFRFKTFAERFRYLLLSSKGVMYFFPLISIVLGTFALTNILQTYLSFIWLSVAAGGLVLLLVELIKSQLLKISYTQLYQGANSGAVVLIVAGAFSALSVFLSLQGAEKIHSRMDKTVDRVGGIYQAKQDSIKAHYAGAIAATQEEIQGIKKHKSERWGGLLSGTERKEILLLQERIKGFQESEKGELAALAGERNKSLSSAGKESKIKFSAFWLIALFVDLFIIAANWFTVFYDWKVYRESLVLNQENFVQNQGKEALNEVSNEVQNPVLNRRIIGFSQNRLGELKADIRSGIKDYRTLMKKHRVNVETVKKAMAEV